MPTELSTRREPDFRIFSGLLKASRGPDDGKMRLHGVASSTTRDLHGDTMLPSALEDMEKAANNNLTIFLNHSYNVPEDVGGSVERAHIKTRGVDQFGNPNYDLDFDVLINDSNPRAVQTFEAIENGVKLGLSIGAMIPDGGASRDKSTKSITIAHVDLLETSLVGIPANPRSWVEYAVKAFNAKELPETEPVPIDTSNQLTVGEAGPETVVTAEAEPEADIEVVESVEELDITDTTVTVQPSGEIQIDTEAPQAAEIVSSPEDGVPVEDSAEPTQEPETPAALKDGTELVQLLQSVATATRELVDARTQVEVEKAARIAAEAERDQLVKGTVRVLKDVRRLLDRIADTPLGRKSQFLGAQSEFDARYGGAIDEEVLKMLLR